MSNQATSMRGKVCLVTGSTSGIGKATARSLARLGATVIVHGRDQRRGEAAIAEIRAASGNPSVDLLLADLSSQVEVRRLAGDILTRYQRVHVLINNAGVLQSQRSVTVDGIETMLAVNYLAPFLLTNLLLDQLKASAPARIVNVASGAEWMARINFDDLNAEQKYSSFNVYSQSKLAVVLFSYELARRLKGTGVTVNCVDPGMVRTDMPLQMPGILGMVNKLLHPFVQTLEQGARASIFAASSPKLEGVTGKYINQKQKLVSSSKQSYDEALARRLWDVSAQMTQLASPSKPIP